MRLVSTRAPTFESGAPLPRLSGLQWVLAALGLAVVLAVLVWQAVSFAGTPDPTANGLSRPSVVLGSGILVFREGLEAVLVLAAITAGLVRYRRGFWGPIVAGVGAALVATVATWFLAVALISSVNAPELAVQAFTGLLAIVVLLVVMNWFFHKLYWTGWIGHHFKRRQRLFDLPGASAYRVAFGLAMLGFTAIYREGFEVVLFLQDLRLKAGTGAVASGAGVGLALTAIVAALTFSAHRRLPYKRMLVWTGVLLAGVLIVMVGESAQEMQQAGWLTVHPVAIPLPAWVGVWFATFPNVEGLAAQAFAIVLVGGSFLWVRSRVPRAAVSRAGTASRTGI